MNLARSFMIGALLALLAPQFVLAAAPPWPEKPVRIIVPWAPGGSTDILARILGAELGRRLKQNFLVENRAGAGSIVGLQFTAQQPADGYTFLMTSTGYGFLINKSNVDLVNSFAAVSMIGVADSALVVNPHLPVNSVKELVALAKKRPGELLFSSSGVGGFPHMNAELFMLMAGVKMTHVPFKGGGPAIVDTVAGNTQLQIGSLPTVLNHVRAKRLKAIAVGGPKRNPALPELPTISESGVPGYESQIWFGMFAPKNLPQPLIAAMHNAINEALAHPEVVKRMDEQGAMVQKMTTAQFAKYMETEQEKWARVIRDANIKGE
jgi:tripartite-type tricarboxylate transporter receptor subunit TctC